MLRNSFEDELCWMVNVDLVIGHAPCFRDKNINQPIIAFDKNTPIKIKEKMGKYTYHYILVMMFMKYNLEEYYILLNDKEKIRNVYQSINTIDKVGYFV